MPPLWKAAPTMDSGSHRRTGPWHDSGLAGKAAARLQEAAGWPKAASRAWRPCSHRSHRGAIVEPGKRLPPSRAGRVRPTRLAWPAPAMGWGWGCYGQLTLWPAHAMASPRLRPPLSWAGRVRPARLAWPALAAAP
eukprot:scaffold73701_cov31-Phaeocystis_antarctica.AAC.1